MNDPGPETGQGPDIGLITHHSNLPLMHGEGFRSWPGRIEGIHGGTIDNEVGWLTVPKPGDSGAAVRPVVRNVDPCPRQVGHA